MKLISVEQIDIKIMTPGSMDAILQNHKRMTHSVYKRAVAIAEKRSKKNYWDSVTLLRKDIEKVLKI